MDGDRLSGHVPARFTRSCSYQANDIVLLRQHRNYVRARKADDVASKAHNNARLNVGTPISRNN
jgi:hypothetical protein